MTKQTSNVSIMYPKVFKELLRILHLDGRAVLLVMSKK
ncbi:hypothetical protein PI124_g24610, partial [Phytophthora idaei]